MAVHQSTHSIVGAIPYHHYKQINFKHSSEMWKICYRLMVLALVLGSFPLISSSVVSRTSPLNNTPQKTEPNSFDAMDQLLSLFFRDLTSEGIMKKTQEEKQKVVFLSNENDNKKGQEFKVVNDYNMDHIPLNDLAKQNSLLDNTVDFIFTSNFPAASKFIDRTLKTGGVVTVLINENPSAEFFKPTNYKVLYMRRFGLIAVAMKKTEPEVTSVVADETTILAAQRKVLGYATEAKKAALKNLEDVLLEPPRAASGNNTVDIYGFPLEFYSRVI
ncbi:hypothetical protein Lalb_Chr17g0344451 [Lupinus albus]|uniref:Uncharacterized protein n=1 Tax=Lupinus albus TaxID=3870 RepID=A0A6A4P961_LUPAL|nr:hypothetical protein Lalb_Chr17g0344451 [Lupinus albus]